MSEAQSCGLHLSFERRFILSCSFPFPGFLPISIFLSRCPPFSFPPSSAHMRSLSPCSVIAVIFAWTLTGYCENSRVPETLSGIRSSNPENRAKNSLGLADRYHYRCPWKDLDLLVDTGLLIGDEKRKVADVEVEGGEEFRNHKLLHVSSG